MPQTGRLRSVRRADYNGTVYDALTSRYTFSCPARGESRVAAITGLADRGPL